MKVLEYHGVLEGPAIAICQLLLVVSSTGPPLFNGSQYGQEDLGDEVRKISLSFSVEVVELC